MFIDDCFLCSGGTEYTCESNSFSSNRTRCLCTNSDGLIATIAGDSCLIYQKIVEGKFIPNPIDMLRECNLLSQSNHYQITCDVKIQSRDRMYCRCIINNPLEDQIY